MSELQDMWFSSSNLWYYKKKAIAQLQVEETYELCVLRIIHDAMKAKDIYNLHLQEHSKEQYQESHGKDQDCIAVLQKTELVPVEWWRCDGASVTDQVLLYPCYQFW